MKATCSVNGCDNKVRTNGMCNKHYLQVWHQGKSCSIDGCGNRIRAHGYCSSHYRRWWKYGDPLHKPINGRARTPRTCDELMAYEYGRAVRDGNCLIDPRARPEWQTQVRAGGVSTSIARFVYQFFTGRRIPEGKIIYHACGRPDCIYVRHLRVGTRAESIMYTRKLGKIVNHGEENHTALLYPAAVREIRKKYWSDPNVMIKSLAEEWGVSTTTIGKVVHRQTWKHIQ